MYTIRLLQSARAISSRSPYVLGTWVRGRPAPWHPRAIPARMPRPREPPAGREFFGTYLAQLPDLRGSPPRGSGRPDRACSHPCWSPGVLLLAAGRALRPRGPYRRCSAPLPHAAGPGSCTGLDLRFLVAGPGFEPGKTVVGDFTDRGRYCPDLGERQSNASFWHAFDMMAWHEPHPLAVWQLVHRSCRGPGRADSHAVG
jgi:hypothetical protein